MWSTRTSTFGLASLSGKRTAPSVGQDPLPSPGAQLIGKGSRRKDVQPPRSRRGFRLLVQHSANPKYKMSGFQVEGSWVGSLLAQQTLTAGGPSLSRWGILGK